MKLKPCPWCKTADHLEVSKVGDFVPKTKGYGKLLAVVCGGCACQGPAQVNTPWARKAWNDRGVQLST